MRSKKGGKMRLCIPTEDKDGMKAKIHGHFGSAPYFTVYDTEKKLLEVIDNTNAHHSHGMCHPLGVLGPSKIDAVVTRGMGAHAVQKLRESNIKIYRADAGTVAETIKMQAEGKLEEMTEKDACAGHGCH